MELIFTDILITKFESFLHHIFAILLLASVVYQPIIICFNFLIPLFIHAIYWLISESIKYDHSIFVLIIYNATFFICGFTNFKRMLLD